MQMMKKLVWLLAINSEIIGWKCLREQYVSFQPSFGFWHYIFSGLSWAWIFPKCQCALCVIVLLADITKDLVKHAALVRIHMSTDSLLIQLVWLSFNGSLHHLFACLFSGTSRPIRRSWPTWTTWQESKSAAIKTKITPVFYLCVHHWWAFYNNPRQTEHVIIALMWNVLLTKASVSFKTRSPILKQMNGVFGTVLWLQQTGIPPHCETTPQQLNLGSKAAEIHFH